MVSTSTYQVCHQCWGAGSSLVRGLAFGLQYMTLSGLVVGFFSGYFGLLPHLRCQSLPGAQFQRRFRNINSLYRTIFLCCMCHRDVHLSLLYPEMQYLHGHRRNHSEQVWPGWAKTCWGGLLLLLHGCLGSKQRSKCDPVKNLGRRGV